jgi:hypothetical protein
MRKIIYPVLLALTLANSAFSQSYTIQNFAGGGRHSVSATMVPLPAPS